LQHHAIMNNKDVKGETPLYSLLHNDFWGQNIWKNDSHKSYRPLTVLNFRIDHNLFGFNKYVFHIENLFLHVLTTVLLNRFGIVLFGRTAEAYVVCISFVGWLVRSLVRWFVRWLVRSFANSSQASGIASILFAIHPIHVEAVTGLVGRAEVLCSTFYLLALLCYNKAAQLNTTNQSAMRWTIIFFVCATLSKETGYTSNRASRVTVRLDLTCQCWRCLSFGICCLCHVQAIASFIVRCDRSSSAWSSSSSSLALISTRAK
jgi:hypothetical protein